MWRGMPACGAVGEEKRQGAKPKCAPGSGGPAANPSALTWHLHSYVTMVLSALPKGCTSLLLFLCDPAPGPRTVRLRAAFLLAGLPAGVSNYTRAWYARFKSRNAFGCDVLGRAESFVPFVLLSEKRGSASGLGSGAKFAWHVRHPGCGNL